MTDNGILLRALIIILVFATFAGQVGLSINGGAVTTTDLSDGEPNALNVLGWVWDGLGFFFAMIVFQVDGMPGWISTIFLIITIALTWVLLKFARGTNT